MRQSLTYIDRETGEIKELVLPNEGTARPANEEELAKDELGFTNPNLHRRIDPQQPTDPEEVLPRGYMFAIENGTSYRTTIINTHDEDSETSEIP